jgi:hypothetical protein
VAVKIIEHSERSPGTASSGGKRINIGRESLLATQMSHPNIVSTTVQLAARHLLLFACRNMMLCALLCWWWMRTAAHGSCGLAHRTLQSNMVKAVHNS